jgi:nitrate/nitrite transport system permease protein
MNQVEIERGVRVARRRVPASGMVAARRIGAAGASLGFTAAGLALLLALWWVLATITGKDLPGPVPALRQLWALVSDPFYDNGPNDKGIGLQLAASLQRVFTGFALGSLIAIPVGILMGANSVVRRVTDPIVQVLRPVSPLAWFPIGLAAFKAAGTATIFVIVITSLWPTIINTAFGVGSVPQDHKNVARVFRFGPWRYLMRVLLPYSFPHIITGLRLSMGIAWMVIVAAEMLSGGTGIGFFVWDSWNALSLPKVMSAILLIGGVGLVLDRGFYLIARRFEHAA